ncbi:ABC transporter permease [Hymenobacter sp. BT664]|uniref:ABC transporter permease n=1 Tax=Hymenobacter montanus TaxID=2771359 RepID=A0A927BBM3_9BACT|nr:ABC transporter permease [Hymenobacter montanus]MBD2767117.1 ABC transporter permease [Hymenobacter montanus]
MANVTISSLSGPQKLALGWLSALVVAAIVAPYLPLPYPPAVPDLTQITQPPSGAAKHWLGTDPQGRDVLSNLLFGARTAVLLTLPAAVLAAGLGALAGGAAGFWGNSGRPALRYWLLGLTAGGWLLAGPPPTAGWVAALATLGGALVLATRRARPGWPFPLDSLVQGTATALDTVPRLVLVVALAAVAGEVSLLGLVTLFTLTSWPHPARLVQAQMLRVRALPFVEAARAAGMTEGRVWLYHALPHAVQPLRTVLPLSMAGLLSLESTLSFLGIGLPPDVASWGRSLAAVRYAPAAWWVFVFPAACLAITLMSLSSLTKQQANSR